MKINSINNYNNTFEAKKFRQIVKKLDVTNPELLQYGRQFKDVNIIKEYYNPKAENLYNKATKSKNINERMLLLSEMGDYEIYDFGEGLLGKARMYTFMALSKVADLLVD